MAFYRYHNVNSLNIIKIARDCYQCYDINGNNIKLTDELLNNWKKNHENVNEQLLDQFESNIKNIKQSMFLVLFNDYYVYIAIKAVMFNGNLYDPRLGPKLTQLCKKMKFSLSNTESVTLNSSKTETKEEMDNDTTKSIYDRICLYFNKVHRKAINILTFGIFNKSIFSNEELQSNQANLTEFSDELKDKVLNLLQEKLNNKKILCLTLGMNVNIGCYRIVITSLQDTDDLENEIIICNEKTIIAYDNDDPGEFESVYLCPFIDTVSSVYPVDLVNDSVKPYFALNPIVRIAEGDRFIYQSVEYKILKTKPSSQPKTITAELAMSTSFSLLAEKLPRTSRSKRVGANTKIYVGHPIIPHWVDIMTPQNSYMIMCLPIPFQSYALISLLADCDPVSIERVITANDNSMRPSLTRAAKANQIIESIEKYKIENLIEAHSNDPCPICLISLKETKTVMLNCDHIFHIQCISNWLTQSSSCPLCKAEFSRCKNYDNFFKSSNRVNQ